MNSSPLRIHSAPSRMTSILASARLYSPKLLARPRRSRLPRPQAATQVSGLCRFCDSSLRVAQYEMWTCSRVPTASPTSARPRITPRVPAPSFLHAYSARHPAACRRRIMSIPPDLAAVPEGVATMITKECFGCEKVTSHEHLHDCAPGIPETHMVGSVRMRSCAEVRAV
jgi:hypothetical protein